MRRSEHIIFLVFLEQRVLVIYIYAAALQTVGSSVVDMIIRASCVVAGPCKVVNAVSLCHDYGLAEIGHSADLTDRSLLNAHHVVVQFCDRRRTVAEQEVRCSIVVCKDGRIDGLSHADSCGSAHINCHKGFAFICIRAGRVICHRNADG